MPMAESLNPNALPLKVSNVISKPLLTITYEIPDQDIPLKIDTAQARRINNRFIYFTLIIGVPCNLGARTNGDPAPQSAANQAGRYSRARGTLFLPPSRAPCPRQFVGIVITHCFITYFDDEQRRLCLWHGYAFCAARSCKRPQQGQREGALCRAASPNVRFTMRRNPCRSITSPKSLFCQ